MMHQMLDATEQNQKPATDPDFIGLIEELLQQSLKPAADKALLARMLTLPDFSLIAQDRLVIHPKFIDAIQKQLRILIGESLRTLLLKVYEDNQSLTTFSVDPTSMAKRALKRVALRYLGDVSLAENLYQIANNMTDRIMALSVFMEKDDATTPARSQILADFYTRFRNYPLVIDKWFSLQSSANRGSALDDIQNLMKHADFKMTNPNRVRSVLGAFAMNNPVQFHRADGASYEFITKQLIHLDSINPHISSRLLTAFCDWRRYEPRHQEMMKSSLAQILATPKLSPHAFEIADKSLNA
jgi:aminopeptidase N